MDMNTVVRFVDDYTDKDPKTRNSSPGKIDQHNLIQVGIQKERRFLILKRIKHVIFQEEGTRNIWYKNNFHYPVAVAMGFKNSQLAWHPKAVSMETYAALFLDGEDKLVISIGTTAKEWLKLNDFELTS